MAGVTHMSRRDSHTCHGDARGRDTPSPPKGALGGVTTSLTDIADRLERLAPSARYPMQFHEEKSELIFAIREAVRDLRVLPPIERQRGELLPKFRSLTKITRGSRAGG